MRFRFSPSATCRVRTAMGPVPARLFRMSYSGELAYEIHVPADRGRAMWNAVIAAGADFGIMPYGTEAMSTLRIEKGHIVVGAEADGRTTAADSGLGEPREQREAVHRLTASFAAGAHRTGSLAARGARPARQRADASRREDRRRSRSRSAEPDARARDVVVPEPQSRCVDRAGARRERTRAPRRDAVGGVAARRRKGPGAGRPSVLHRSQGRAAAWLTKTSSRSARRWPGHYGAAATGRHARRDDVRGRVERAGQCGTIRRSTPRCARRSAFRFPSRRTRPTRDGALTALWLGPSVVACRSLRRVHARRFRVAPRRDQRRRRCALRRHREPRRVDDRRPAGGDRPRQRMLRSTSIRARSARARARRAFSDTSMRSSTGGAASSVFTLMVARSLARDAWHSLCQSAAQYGYDIAAPASTF